jgi:hypothetical protein
MTAPVIADCVGSWRRSLLIDADGGHHAGGEVRWLQGITAYVDSRGFAGRLQQSGNVFQWHRDVDLEPPGPFPDAGAMHWDGDVLIETGVHQAYVEHWVREGGSTDPCGALFLHASDGATGLLVRVGELFGWAGGGAVVIGTVGDAEYGRLGIAPAGEEVRANGIRWRIDRSEGTVNP